MTPAAKALLDQAKSSAAALSVTLAQLEVALVDAVPPIVVPPVQPVAGITKQAMNLAAMVVFDAWHESSRYERFQRLTILQGLAKIAFHGEDFAAGGAVRVLSAPAYKLLVDGIERSTANIAPGASRGVFDLDATKFGSGWHKFDIVCAQGETCPTWCMHVGATPAGDAIPVATGSYEVAHYGSPHFTASVPRDSAPKALPLGPRECPAFNTALPMAQLFRENLVPCREGNLHRISATRAGVQATFNKQAYFWDDAIRKIPPLPLLDGPRNVGTLCMPTTLLTTRQGGVYFSDPWRIGRITPDGEITTRAGHRHRKPPSNYGETSPEIDLVGDWSSIPVERRGFHEIWGIAWDMDSLALDPAAPPIGGEQPHLTGPRMFVADTQNNRVCLLTFKADDHSEPVVTEFLTGLTDPWDVAYAAGVLYVTERKANRIAAYDAKTGAFLRVVVSGQALSSIDQNRKVIRGAALDVIRAQPCVSPEGLALQDGWLYFGSYAMGQVRKVNLTTGEIKVVCAPVIDDNSRFVKLSLSDGTFGPRGTVFVSTWSIQAFGLPAAYLPDGTGWGYHTFERVSCGLGGAWESLGYSSASGVGLGRMVCGSSEMGLAQISKGLPTDKRPNVAQYQRGAVEYGNQGLTLLHGSNGFGEFGLPLPWGKSADMDYFFSINGHVNT